MLFHIFGEENTKTIVMIHGLAMSWDMLQEAIGILAREYQVAAIAVPGMDLESQEEFTSVEEIAGRIEQGLLDRGIKTVECLYGLSMGGGIALRMLADGRIRCRHVILDAAITPYELPWIATRLILVKDVLMTLLGKASKPLLELAFPPEDYSQETVDCMEKVMHYMTLRTIWRAYDSTDNYEMPGNLRLPGTDIWYWYGEKEKQERRLDLQYVRKHVKNVRFRKIPQMRHGQYVITKPERFAGDVTKIIGGRKL